MQKNTCTSKLSVARLNLLSFFSEQRKPQHFKIYLKETKILLWGVCVKIKGNLLIRYTLSKTEERYSQHFYFPLNATENRIKSRVWIPHSSLMVRLQVMRKNQLHGERQSESVKSWNLWLSCVWSGPGEHGFTIRNHLHKENKERANDTVLYLHGLRLVHGFDCILCHCPCRKCDKRTACGNKGTGSRKDKKQQDKRVGRLLNQHSLRERPQGDTVLSST